jgi:hypothetical protein
MAPIARGSGSQVELGGRDRSILFAEEIDMRTVLRAIIIGTSLAACSATFPVPTQRMADAESAERSARELGAEGQPTARLHLRLAQEQIAKAKNSVGEGENERADLLLVRATADAELALALAREQAAESQLQLAVAAKAGAPQ